MKSIRKPRTDIFFQIVVRLTSLLMSASNSNRWWDIPIRYHHLDGRILPAALSISSTAAPLDNTTTKTITTRTTIVFGVIGHVGVISTIGVISPMGVICPMVPSVSSFPSASSVLTVLLVPWASSFSMMPSSSHLSR